VLCSAHYFPYNRSARITVSVERSAPTARRAVDSGGIAEVVAAGKSIQSQKGDGGVSDKTGWEGRDQQLGARIGIVWTLSRALGPAKENIYALESLDGYIVLGC
jgi:hypothetical protein